MIVQKRQSCLIKAFVLLSLVVGIRGGEAAIAQDSGAQDSDAQDSGDGVYAATASLFEARDLLLDITDRSASIARRKAFEQAQIQAYRLLIRKLTGANAEALASATPLDEIVSLVSGIDILGEQTSSRRYRGRMTVRFDPDSFTAHLSSLQIPHVLSAGPDIRILERHIEKGRVNLWSPTDTQKQARESLDLANRIRRYSFHAPTLSDRYEIPVGRPNLDTVSTFERVADASKEGESVLFMETEFTGDGAVLVRYRLSSGSPELPLVVGARETPEQTLAAAYLTVMDRIDTTWRSRLLVDTSLEGAVAVDLIALSANDFNEVLLRLRSIPLIKTISINGITVPISKITLQHQGRLDQLTLALDYGGLQLKQVGEAYRLALKE